MKQILTSSGKLVSDLGEEEEGEVRDVQFELLQMKTALYLWSELQYHFKTQNWSHINILQPQKLPTQPTYLAFFLLFVLGALRLADPALQFFFWLPSYLNLHLLLPRAQIKQLGSYDSLPI